MTLVLTYLIHSTVILSVVWLLDRLVLKDPGLRDTVWKAAFVVSIAAPLVSTQGVSLRPGGRETVAGEFYQSRKMLLSDRESGPVQGSSRRTARVDMSCWQESVRGPVPDPASALRAMDECAAAGAPGSRLWLFPVLALSLLMTVRHLRTSVLLQSVLREGRPLRAPPFGSQDRTRVLVHEGITGPFAAGLRTVVLPARSLQELSASQLRAVVAHEAVHLERRDPLWQWFARLVEAALYFQPLNRVCRRRLEEVAELVSDDDARRRVGGGRALAESIAVVSGWSLEGSVAPGLSRRRGLVGDRVSRLLDPDPGVQLPHFHLRVALVALVVAIAWSLPGVQGAGQGTAQIEVFVGSVTEDVTTELPSFR